MVQLNEEQLAAVQHPLDQPACLIAGAGSGKTKVLTERVRWLMQQGVTPKRICAITFTNKAAGELVSRLGINPEADQREIPRVSTIHSLALSCIRRNPQGFGLGDKVTPLDDYDQTQLLKKAIERINPDAKDTAKTAYKVLRKIQYHRARGLGFSNEYTDEYAEQALEEYSGENALDNSELELWGLYEQEKKRQSVVDFDDMLHLVVRRIRTDPRWLALLQKQFDYVLMDEAQDTNPVQWEFVNGLLGPENKNLYVVGDMSQSIYGFNGAVPEILLRYSEGWRGMVPSLYRISRNHRSMPKIIDLANKIQRNMSATIPLKMAFFRGGKEDLGVVKTFKGDFASNIANAMAAEIYRDASVKTNPIPYKDNCILVRASIQMRELETALVRYRIPYVIRGGQGLLQTEEVKDVLSYLRLATNPKDFMALSRTMSAPKRGVGDKALEKLREIANAEFDGNLIEACARLKKDEVDLFVALMRDIQKFKDDPLAALDKIIKGVGYKSYLENKYKKEPNKVKDKLENLDRLIEMITALLEETEMTTEDLMFKLSLDKGKEDDPDGAVTISTIHAAKGLEWPRVYIANVHEESLPHFRSRRENEIEEERRLFYVAVTRARDICVIGLPGLSMNGASTKFLKPSRFLFEVGIVS